MFKLLWLLCLLPISATPAAQGYKPARGETDVKLEIEGRGTVVMKLFPQDAPKATAHVLQLVKSGFYNGLRFHRVEKTPKPYLVQVGDPQSRDGALDDKSTQLSGESIPFEDSGHQNLEGAVGLARSDEDQKSGDTQFYISLATNKFLDGKYTVFGQVILGMDVVRKIERGDLIERATILKG